MPPPSVDDLVARLRDVGVRMTAPRRAVLEVLSERGSHQTAESIHQVVAERLPDVSQSSVYRTMDLLADHGIVDHVHLGHGPAEYHLRSDEHGHLVCTDCGMVQELSDDLSRPFRDRIATDLGFEVDFGHFAVTGRCRACADAAAADEP